MLLTYKFYLVKAGPATSERAIHLTESLPEDMIISPSNINVSHVIGQGNSLVLF